MGPDVVYRTAQGSKPPLSIRAGADQGLMHCPWKISGNANGKGMLKGATQRCLTHLLPVRQSRFDILKLGKLSKPQPLLMWPFHRSL